MYVLSQTLTFFPWFMYRHAYMKALLDFGFSSSSLLSPLYSGLLELCQIPVCYEVKNVSLPPHIHSLHSYNVLFKLYASNFYRSYNFYTSYLLRDFDISCLFLTYGGLSHIPYIKQS